MTSKQEFIEVIQRLPDDVTFEQLVEELYVWEKIREGIRQAEAGELIAHEDIEREFLKDE